MLGTKSQDAGESGTDGWEQRRHGGGVWVCDGVPRSASGRCVRTKAADHEGRGGLAGDAHGTVCDSARELTHVCRARGLKLKRVRDPIGLTQRHVCMCACAWGTVTDVT